MKDWWNQEKLISQFQNLSQNKLISRLIHVGWGKWPIKWGVWAIETSTYTIFWSINKTPFEISQNFYFVLLSMFAIQKSSQWEFLLIKEKLFYIQIIMSKKSGIFLPFFCGEKFRRKEIEINKIWHFIWMNFL